MRNIKEMTEEKLEEGKGVMEGGREGEEEWREGGKERSNGGREGRRGVMEGGREKKWMDGWKGGMGGCTHSAVDKRIQRRE